MCRYDELCKRPLSLYVGSYRYVYEEAPPMKDKTAQTAAAAWDKVITDLGIPASVYSDDGSEFKKQFKEK